MSRLRLYQSISDGLRGLHSANALRGMDSLPNFIIIGAAKSATTTLTTILPRHPDIFLCRPKEPKFFGRNYDKGWAWYHKIFSPGEGYACRGEASTMYSSHIGSFRYTPRLMHRYLPHVKIIYIVRHPLERLVSHWRHLKGRNPEFVSFERVLSNGSAKERLIGCSSYYARIQEFRKFFPDDQIHCLTFEDLVLDPPAVLVELLNFLGVSADCDLLLDEGRLPRVNSAGEKGRIFVEAVPWPVRMRQRIVNVLRPDSDSFLMYIGKPLNYWTW